MYAKHCIPTQGFLGSPHREESKFLVSLSCSEDFFVCKVLGLKREGSGLSRDTVVRTVLAFIAAKDEDCASVLLWVGLWGS